MKLKLFLGGGAAGVIVTTIVLFSTGWMVTSGLADRMQRDAVHDALKNQLASICVAQFKESSDQQTMVTAMQKVQTWERGDFVSEQGWATMPGQKDSESFVANECAARIIAQSS